MMSFFIPFDTRIEQSFEKPFPQEREKKDRKREEKFICGFVARQIGRCRRNLGRNAFVDQELEKSRTQPNNLFSLPSNIIPE